MGSHHETAAGDGGGEGGMAAGTQEHLSADRPKEVACWLLLLLGAPDQGEFQWWDFWPECHLKSTFAF